MIKIDEIEDKIRNEASTVLWYVVLFIIYYVTLILAGIGLLAAAFGFSLLLLKSIGGVWTAVILWFSLQIAWYLIKPLFAVHRSSKENNQEIHREDCPELFSIIEDIANKTGNKMPKHIYLSAELNARVFYNSMNIWSIFLPTSKNLMIGTRLLYGMSNDELKAILAHEFGHFSQQTMKISSVTYRLLLIIRGMIEFTQKEQKKASSSLSNKNSWEPLFHLASWPMKYVTKLTVKFYNFIEKRNCSLSRYMEFEADSVACRIVGAKPFISSICKLEVLSSRYEIFEKVIVQLLQEKRYITDYGKGYEIVDKLIADDEEISISYDMPLETLINEDAIYPSKISIIDGWDTHPSTFERIENASQFINANLATKPEDARQLVGSSIISEIGIKQQQFICEHLEDNISWSELKEMPIDEFRLWVVEQFKTKRIPDFLFPFVDMEVLHFNQPSDERMAETAESPFTRQNRNLLLETNSCLKDWETLDNLLSDNIKTVIYDGSICDVRQAIETHEQYLNTLRNKLADLEQNIFIYLYQQAKAKDDVTRIYWMIFYGSDSIENMAEILDTASAIQQQEQICEENGQTLSLNDDIKTDLAQKLWNFLQSFDFEKVYSVCEKWTYGEDDEPITKLLQQSQDFASAECDCSIDYHELIYMINSVYSILYQLSESGKEELNALMFSIVYHKGDFSKGDDTK